jgi:hypothetical protein
MVLVCVTGGAYRAGFWAGVVLDRLQALSGPDAAMAGLADSVRLITGASGGMVGAAYFALGREPSPPRDGYRSVVDVLDDQTGGDSLTPILQQLFCRDLPQIFVPLPYQKKDRGVVLDEQWDELNKATFLDLREGEREGWRPSLVLSPMVVETGRRMLISNLDLAYLTETAAARGAVYSRSAVEFFKEFPGSYGSFKLATSVRMSATFPFASPAVNLPTDPPRRLVDAGYYDNYGVDLATAWAYHHRDWIVEHTSGLALIQIQAYATQGPKLNVNLVEDVSPDPPPPLAGALGRSFQWLTSPATGAGSARTWTMAFRNDELVRQLDDDLNGRAPGMFETFVFENPVPFGMNWFISRHDIAAMRRTVDVDGNRQEMCRLSDWWPREAGPA